MLKILIPVFTLFYLSAQSQDTLFYRSGEKKSVTVNEINPDLIKFHKFENPDGPAYTIRKSEVIKIKYSGGHIDSFPAVKVVEVIEATPKKAELVYYGTKIFYDSKPIDGHEFLNMINNFSDETSRKKMQQAHKQMVAHRDISTVSLTTGLVLGCAVVIATNPYVAGLNDGLAPTEDGINLALAGIAAGAIMRVSAFVFHKVHRNKSKAKTRQIVSIYNGDYIFK